MILIKNKANWKPTFKKRFLQYIASLKALITYPFFRSIDGGVKIFFEKNYKIKRDSLIFDGNTYRYLEQITNVIDLSKLNDVDIIDLGCGTGSFLIWLENNNIDVKSYLGLDFACDSRTISDNKKIINQDMFDFEIPQRHCVVMINVACYFDDKQLDDILIKIKEKNCRLIIIEPYPHFFWDKHFDGIKPYYRKTDNFLALLQMKGYKIERVSIDYFFMFFKKHISPVSFCIFAK
jgi:hypothetical protein